MVVQFRKETFKKTTKTTTVIKQNVLYEDFEKKVWGTAETDQRIMSFVDLLWGFEVTGGVDQYEPLTVIAVRRSGYSRRAGIRLGDIITKINTTPADNLTLKEAQLLIRESGKYVRIYVRGDNDEDSDDELTVDFWFKPPSADELARMMWRPKRLHGVFPWNDRNKPVYKESNCFLVTSRWEIKHENDPSIRRTPTPSPFEGEKFPSEWEGDSSDDEASYDGDRSR